MQKAFTPLARRGFNLGKVESPYYYRILAKVVTGLQVDNEAEGLASP